MKKVNVDNCMNCDKFGIMNEYKDIFLCVHCFKASAKW